MAKKKEMGFWECLSRQQELDLRMAVVAAFALIVGWICILSAGILWSLNLHAEAKILVLVTAAAHGTWFGFSLAMVRTFRRDCGYEPESTRIVRLLLRACNALLQPFRHSASRKEEDS